MSEERTKHTPGPWAIGSQVFAEGFNLYSDRERCVVAWIAPRCNAEDETGSVVEPADMTKHPDAQLIAAAPELLRVVAVIADWAKMGADKVFLSSLMPDQGGDETLADAARAAIAKAEWRE